MPDLSAELTARILANRLPALPLKEDCVHPAYDGLSILNLPASLTRWLEAGELHHAPLDLPGLDELASGAQQVICVLIDAVALHRFRGWAGRSGSRLAPWLEQGLLGALTSVVPSTTSAALTTLWTGRSPAEHGVMGYEVFLKEYGLIANMINHSPAAFEGRSGMLYDAGFDPGSFLPVETIGPQLQAAGVEVHAFLHYSIITSGLSRMHYPAVQTHSFAHPSDLWIAVRSLANQPLDHRRLIWVYYGGVDGLSHRHGPDSEQAEAEFTQFSDMMVAELLDKLDRGLAGRTLVLLLADHGQLATRRDPNFELGNHAGLTRRLHILPTGENRLAYLFVRPGQIAAVEEYLERSWPGAFSVHHSSQLLEAGLFGPGKPASRTLERLGDLTVIAHQDAYLWWAAKENPLIGRHGGLSQEEMLVPLLALRPD